MVGCRRGTRASRPGRQASPRSPASSLPGGPLRKHLRQAAGTQARRPAPCAEPSVREHEFDALEAVFRGRLETIQETVLGVEHAEVGCELGHGACLTTCAPEMPYAVHRSARRLSSARRSRQHHRARGFFQFLQHRHRGGRCLDARPAAQAIAHDRAQRSCRRARARGSPRYLFGHGGVARADIRTSGTWPTFITVVGRERRQDIVVASAALQGQRRSGGGNACAARSRRAARA